MKFDIEFDASKLTMRDRDFLIVWADDLKVPVNTANFAKRCFASTASTVRNFSFIITSDQVSKRRMVERKFSERLWSKTEMSQN